MIIRTLTSYQIEQLKTLFVVAEIHHLGRADETGDVIVEYTFHFSKDSGMQIKNIPLWPFKEKETKDAEYEVLTPKQ
jgi:hypothetical protein